MKCVGQGRTSIALVVGLAAVALSLSAIPSQAYWVETQLAGVRLGDDWMTLLEMRGYGNPDGIIVATSTAPEHASPVGSEVAGGQGALGLPTGNLGQGFTPLQGAGQGGGLGIAQGTTRGIPTAIAPMEPVQAGIAMVSPPSLNITGPGITAGQATQGLGGMGGMMGGMGGMMGAGPGGAGMGGGAVTLPGGTSGVVGFSAAQGVSDFPDWVMSVWFDLHEDEIELFYIRDKVAVGFVVKKRTGKIVAISVAGEQCDFARTALNKAHETIKLGDDLKQVCFRYGQPHDLETFTGSGAAANTNFGEPTTVTFGGVTNQFRRDCVLWYHEVRGLKQSNVAFTLHDLKVTRMHIWIPDPV